jgi:MATE family multidrug resistance protein
MSNQIIKTDILPLLKLAIPLIMTGVLQSSLGFFENIFLSRLGEDFLAAGALVSWLFATLIVIIF